MVVASNATISIPAARGLWPRKKMTVQARFSARLLPSSTHGGRSRRPTTIMDVAISA
jgi:hypothetical protein